MPTDACEIGLELDCLPPLGAATCGTIPEFTTICRQRPFEMIFRYNGGDCDGSFNIQPGTLFQCFDFKGGPPIPDGELSYIIAFEFGGGESYFEGFVKVGEEFRMLAETKFDANMNVTIYNPGNFTAPSQIKTPANLLQTILYHSSCSQNLFLKDRFGSVQLVVFVNLLQGTVSCFQNATLTFTMTTPIQIDGSATLTALTVISNINNEENNGFFNLTDKVFGREISESMPLTVSQLITLDLTVRMKYVAVSTVIGESAEGRGCFGTDFFEFVAGNPLPPIFPTLAPSAAPTISPFPTPDPDEAPCELDAEITCELASGGSCRHIASPAGKTCLGSNVNRLSFIYNQDDCNEDSNNQDKFKCEDFNLHIPFPEEVGIRFSRRGTAVFSGIVHVGQIFSVNPPDVNDLDIEIFTVATDNGPMFLLQEMKISTRCREKDAITLLDIFGSLQLVGYSNPDQGDNNIVEQFVFKYIVKNGGRLDGELRGAFKTSFDPVPETLLDASRGDNPVDLMPGEVEIFKEVFDLNLAAASGEALQFTFLVNGVGEQSREACFSTDIYTLRIG